MNSLRIFFYVCLEIHVLELQEFLRINFHFVVLGFTTLKEYFTPFRPSQSNSTHGKLSDHQKQKNWLALNNQDMSLQSVSLAITIFNKKNA